MNPSKFPRIEKQPADARTLAVLRNMIIEGVLTPGSRVTEVLISGEMGVSLATVRTALHQLAKEGLVSLTPYTGWTVVTFSPKDIWELYTLRAAVERLAAQLVAENGDPHQARIIDEAIKNLERACRGCNGNDIAQADFAFHHAIVQASNHGRLQEQYGLIEHQIRVYIASSDALIAHPSEILAQHEPIAAAILDRDPALAAALSESHNLLEGKKLRRLREGPQI